MSAPEAFRLTENLEEAVERIGGTIDTQRNLILELDGGQISGRPGDWAVKNAEEWVLIPNYTAEILGLAGASNQ